ncbi:hypothetical protein AYL99_04145 [Fonsecaea erecta]|uniref:L-serine ammonia-lyase n=1 Tax=Fonsecaea erecta TaxID=1367422 RepID=A0A178ZQM1_9EURO|nr:hypothetical protein AYL99_04145 [Fonsecaea erecta]OAP61942.1 hypothetical protein AYL99_04145 [Fonsecaea erecta]
MAYAVNTASVPDLVSPLFIREADLNRGSRVFLKLDNLQPAGSFKSRGIGNYIPCRAIVRRRSSSKSHFYLASGGNAGIACVDNAKGADSLNQTLHAGQLVTLTCA